MSIAIAERGAGLALCTNDPARRQSLPKTQKPKQKLLAARGEVSSVSAGTIRQIDPVLGFHSPTSLYEPTTRTHTNIYALTLSVA